MSCKDDFIAIYEQNIHREGADNLLEYLKKSDFFTAPASSRFHLAEEGGLVRHSLNVYFRLKELVENEAKPWAENVSDETVAICGLLHDVCKISMYKTDYRNQKQPDGSWIQVPYCPKTSPSWGREKFRYFPAFFRRGGEIIIFADSFIKVAPEGAWFFAKTAVSLMQIWIEQSSRSVGI